MPRTPRAPNSSSSRAGTALSSSSSVTRGCAEPEIGLGKPPRCAVCLALAGLLAGRAAARGAEGGQPPTRNHYVVSPATSPIHVDGVLDEPAWASATVVPIN